MAALQIIGIAGTNGAGKDTVGHILAEQHGYLFVSVTDLLRREAERRGLEVSRENLRAISAEWRRQSGLGVLVDKAVAECEAAGKYPGVIVASLRNPGETDHLHDLGGKMIWVDADQRVRYDRVQAGMAERGRAGEDRKTFEQFQAEEAAEMHTGGDSATVDMAEVKKRCDVFVDNNEDDVAKLRSKLENS